MPFAACLETFAAEQAVEDYMSAAAGRKTTVRAPRGQGGRGQGDRKGIFRGGSQSRRLHVCDRQAGRRLGRAQTCHRLAVLEIGTGWVGRKVSGGAASKVTARVLELARDPPCCSGQQTPACMNYPAAVCGAGFSCASAKQLLPGPPLGPLF